MTALPTPFRETLVLRQAHGLSYQEIAEMTEVPIGTVMSRLARGRNRLLAAIGKKTSTELHHDSPATTIRQGCPCRTSSSHNLPKWRSASKQ
jgi:Sigma-70, region 4